MSTKEKKYYILYKTTRDVNNNVIDLKYIYEFTTYNEIRDYLKCSFRDIKTMINKDYNNNLFTHKDYCIIKE